MNKEICGNLKVILGCGNQKREGWIGLDKGDYGQEIIRDMCKGLPFCDDSCSNLFADQVLEHIQLNEDFIFIMNECLRVLKNDGLFEIQVPHYKEATAFKDPTHCRFFAEGTWTYMIPQNDWQYGFDKRWEVVSSVKEGHHVHAILKAKKYDNNESKK